MLPSPAGSGVLHDATVREDFRQALLTLIERNATVALTQPGRSLLEIAASLAAAATRKHRQRDKQQGAKPSKYCITLSGQPTTAAAAGEVHLRPHESFPASEPGPRTQAQFAGGIR